MNVNTETWIDSKMYVGTDVYVNMRGGGFCWLADTLAGKEGVKSY